MLKFYHCGICENLILSITDSGMTPSCCGEEMTELVPGSTDAAKEKHVPVIQCSTTLSGKNTVQITVGSLPHPSEANHYIEWIVLETNKGFHLRRFNPGDAPHTTFTLCKEEHALNAYAYCSLHGLWVAPA